ncbi:hypothetical protein JCM17823_04540 [Halorubrum gandharaense]
MSRPPASQSHQLWLMLFAGSVAMLVLLGWSFLYLEPGTASYVIGQVSAGVLLVTIIGSATALFSGWEPF